MKTIKNNKTKNNTEPKKYYDISGQLITVNQECEIITDEQIETMMFQESYYGYNEIYV